MNFVPAKQIITRTADGMNWFGCDYNMNIYRGCSHGCIYCDSRSDCYRIENFSEIRAKAGALALIERELKAKRKKGVVGTGAMSDPYNPEEAEHYLTGGALELIDKYGFGVSLLTKSALVTRDIDRFRRIAGHSPVCVMLTVTTAEDRLCSLIEPHVAVTSKRLAAVRELTAAGVFTGIVLMPVLPFINAMEENVAAVVTAAAAAGARFIYPGFGVTLRQNQREYYYRQLDRYFPGVKDRYVKTFGNRYECVAPNARRLREVFTRRCDRYGIVYRMPDIIAGYQQGYGSEQMTLF